MTSVETTTTHMLHGGRTVGDQSHAKAFGAAFVIKLVPFLFFVLWAEPGDNPLIAINVAHTLLALALVAGFFVSIPVWAVMFYFVNKDPPSGPRTFALGLLYYIALTPPMAFLAMALRGDAEFFSF